MQSSANKNRIVWMLLAITSLVLIAIFAMGYFENQQSFYANYKEAKKSGAFERGWLPEYLPKSAKNIHEQHNLDTNQGWADFEFDVKDITKMESHCQLSEKNQHEQKFSCSETDKTAETFVLQLDGKGYYTSSYKH